MGTNSPAPDDDLDQAARRRDPRRSHRQTRPHGELLDHVATARQPTRTDMGTSLKTRLCAIAPGAAATLLSLGKARIERTAGAVLGWRCRLGRALLVEQGRGGTQARFCLMQPSKRMPSTAIALASVAFVLFIHGAPAAAVDMPAGDPCRLLTRADVAGVMPGAQVGKPDRSREKYGIKACVWEWDSGSFALQMLASKQGAADELRGTTIGYTNLLARNSIRHEIVPGLGDAAFAAVEPVDAGRGVIADMAVLTAQHGTQVILLQSAALARGDRASALKALTVLGRISIMRMSAP